MKLSVVIVNYNVKYFLEQCLLSVLKSIQGIEGEIWVVDNNSVDGSVELVKEKFPQVKVIANSFNAGFSKANNQAIRQSEGEYILLLNPDTVVEESTFSMVIQFMDSHADAGGLGVYMIDGKGRFLPESKRGLPTPAVAFSKVFGLSSLFPKSKVFGRYHLGYLDKEKVHPVEVLSGAFMMLRREALDKTGLLDEDYFMYGEDIDLSYRIIKAGYKNYYFPGTRIIHYKGESTKKSSVNYVIVFYKAMVIFARKHFSQSHAAIFSILINSAIWFRAGIALFARMANKAFLPVCDGLLFYSGMYLLKNYWETSVKTLNYPPFFVQVVIPVYVLIWIAGIFLSGGYDKPVRYTKILRGILSGTFFILVVYALLPETLRFSRALILIGTFWAGISAVLLRIVLFYSGVRSLGLNQQLKKRIIIAADQDEGQRILSMLNLSGISFTLIGFARIQDEFSDQFSIGRTAQLSDLIRVYDANEVIFSSRDISSSEIMKFMQQDIAGQIEFKIAPPESMYIIGSNSIHAQSSFYLVDINAFSNPVNRRKKRIFDLMSSSAVLILFPFTFLVFKNPLTKLSQAWSVFTAKKTWIGIRQRTSAPAHIFLKDGIYSPADIYRHLNPDEATCQRILVLYLKEYSVMTDLKIVWKCLRHAT
ncbi:MAG: glycosyltransferase family 2 protein [Bacteroidia bacterium]|nr:glycosyltransferase [Bacteroidia bacterium]MCZ2276949.1 glycosyltransferase family 2 protein [Bacteroidia bacterium]